MPLRRSFVMISIAWKWFSHFSALALVSLGAAYALTTILTSENPVFVAEHIEPMVRVAPPGGVIEYTYTQRRYETCPGTVVEAFSSLDGERKILREQRRSVEFPTAGVRDLHIKVPVPKDLPPGRYRYRDYIISACPLRERTDPIAEFEVEVRP